MNKKYERIKREMGQEFCLMNRIHQPVTPAEEVRLIIEELEEISLLVRHETLL